VAERQVLQPPKATSVRQMPVQNRLHQYINVISYLEAWIVAFVFENLVGGRGFEPLASRSRSVGKSFSGAFQAPSCIQIVVTHPLGSGLEVARMVARSVYRCSCVASDGVNPKAL